jgi:hypothetical protein
MLGSPADKRPAAERIRRRTHDGGRLGTPDCAQTSIVMLLPDKPVGSDND